METKQVELTTKELAEFEQFKAERAKKEQAQKDKENRDAYKQLVDEQINEAFPNLTEIANSLKDAKGKVMENFKRALELKGEIFKIKADQKSHTFTNSEGNRRITIGVYSTDDYRDTVNDGIAMVKEVISSLAKDNQSKALVDAILKLLSRDQKGNLKASRVLQLKKLAEEINNERFTEGVKIIEESYQPAVSKTYIRAEYRDAETNAWINVPLGMTEA